MKSKKMKREEAVAFFKSVGPPPSTILAVGPPLKPISVPEALDAYGSLREEFVNTRAEVTQLRESLAQLTNVTIWMTGSADFGEGGKAHQGYLKMRHVIDRAL